MEVFSKSFWSTTEGDTNCMCVSRETIPEVVTLELVSNRSVEVSLGREVGLDIQGTNKEVSNT